MNVLNPGMVVLLAWTGALASAHGQLTLRAGESQVHRFLTLTPAGSGSAGGGFVAGGTLQVALDMASVQAGDALRCEVFEGDTNQPAVCVFVVTNAAGGSCFAPGAWADRAGAVRFTALSGAMTVNSFTLQASTFFPPSFAYYYTTTVAPPPVVRPTLGIQRESADVRLSWPATAEDWILQTSPGIGPAAWTTVAATPEVENGMFVVTLPASGPRAFFRLTQP